MRWDTPLDAGYARLAEGDVFFSHGVFSLLYIPRHLYAIFLQPPVLNEGSPWLFTFDIRGMSLFLTTPAFLWCFAALRHLRRDGTIALAALGAILALLPDMLHGTVGFAQFGYRFSLDAQPFRCVGGRCWGRYAMLLLGHPLLVGRQPCGSPL